LVSDQAHAIPSRRALIVDDEFLIAFDLEESMRDLGFEICDVAPNAKKAMALAVTNQPDVVLMDVYLGGTREGIEAGRWFARYVTLRWFSSPPTLMAALANSFVK
jgi:DNA-binding NarL/FixJ family response regulator